MQNSLISGVGVRVQLWTGVFVVKLIFILFENLFKVLEGVGLPPTSPYLPLHQRKKRNWQFSFLNFIFQLLFSDFSVAETSWPADVRQPRELLQSLPVLPPSAGPTRQPQQETRSARSSPDRGGVGWLHRGTGPHLPGRPVHPGSRVRILFAPSRGSRQGQERVHLPDKAGKWSRNFCRLVKKIKREQSKNID